MTSRVEDWTPCVGLFRSSVIILGRGGLVSSDGHSRWHLDEEWPRISSSFRFDSLLNTRGVMYLLFWLARAEMTLFTNAPQTKEVVVSPEVVPIVLRRGLRGVSRQSTRQYVIKYYNTNELRSFTDWR